MKTLGVLIILAAIVMAVLDAIIGLWWCVVVNMLSVAIVAKPLYEMFKRK